MFELDVKSRKPIYEQLVEKIKELIINDVLKPDEQLPPVRVLALDLSINPNTIQKLIGNWNIWDIFTLFPAKEIMLVEIRLR